jgi:thioesterase domain-containing protein
MDITTLFSTLRQRGVQLGVEDGRLKCSAPAGVLDADLRALLASRKDEILSVLRRAEALNHASASIVPIKPNGSRTPIFALSGHGGDVYYLLGLARHLDADQPVFGVQPAGLDGGAPLTTVEALARYEIEQIRRVQPEGPYLIVGHCAGGTIAFEAARQLTATRQHVAMLALIGSPFPTAFRAAAQLLLRLGRHVTSLATGPLSERRRYLAERFQARLRPPAPVAPLPENAAVLAARHRVERTTVAAVRAYRPGHYPGQIDIFVTSDRWHRSDQWRAHAAATREHVIAGFEIDDLLLGPHVSILANAVQKRLDTVWDDTWPAITTPRSARSR